MELCRFRDEQISETVGSDGRRKGFSSAFWIPVCRVRELDSECCPAFLSIAAGNAAAMFLNDPVACTESEADALSNGLRCIEGIKYSLWFTSAWSGVRYLDNYRCILLTSPNRDAAFAVFFQRLQRVGHNVQ